MTLSRTYFDNLRLDIFAATFEYEPSDLFNMRFVKVGAGHFI